MQSFNMHKSSSKTLKNRGQSRKLCSLCIISTAAFFKDLLQIKTGSFEFDKKKKIHQMSISTEVKLLMHYISCFLRPYLFCFSFTVFVFHTLI